MLMDFGLIDLDVAASSQTVEQVSFNQASPKPQAAQVETNYQAVNSSTDEKANIQAALDSHKGVIARVAKITGFEQTSTLSTHGKIWH